MVSFEEITNIPLEECIDLAVYNPDLKEIKSTKVGNSGKIIFNRRCHKRHFLENSPTLPR